MIYPIVAYGSSILRKECVEIDELNDEIKRLINDMFETMYDADGVGLAAPQIGKNLRLFVIDASPFSEDEPELENFKKVFINPELISESGKKWSFKEGCLSIPGVREEVSRHETLVLNYLDENFVEHEETFSGLAARVIQHEYDHIEGILFTDKINTLKRQLIKGKLNDIAKGKFNADYKMKIIK